MAYLWLYAPTPPTVVLGPGRGGLRRAAQPPWPVANSAKRRHGWCGRAQDEHKITQGNTFIRFELNEKYMLSCCPMYNNIYILYLINLYKACCFFVYFKLLKASKSNKRGR